MKKQSVDFHSIPLKRFSFGNVSVHIFFFFFLFSFFFANSQNIGIGTNAPKAALDVSSTSNGFLPPRMTFAQRNAIQNPSAGLIVYCINCGNGEMQYFNGTNWMNMTVGMGSVPFVSPTLSTTSISSITQTTAVSGGSITSDGGATVTERGVVWSTSPNPTVNLTTKTSNGTGTGSFTSNITGLTSSTTYYVRSYATNRIGTSYGNELSFKTQDPPPTNVTDIDGNIYSVVTIGSQVWMAENLRTTKYRNGETIPYITDNTQWSNNLTGAWSYHNNDEGNNMTYGKLYNWYAVANSNQLCPTGWRIPSDAEWTTLINFLDPAADGGNNTVNTAGGMMKGTGTQYWTSPNKGATNSSKFSGLPGGLRKNDGTFNPVGLSGSWWSSTEFNSSLSWYRYLDYFFDYVYRFYYNKSFGLSVRCIMN